MTNDSAIRKIIHLSGVSAEAKLEAIHLLLEGLPQDEILQTMGIVHERLHPQVDKLRLEAELLPLLRKNTGVTLEPTIIG